MFQLLAGSDAIDLIRHIQLCPLSRDVWAAARCNRWQEFVRIVLDWHISGILNPWKIHTGVRALQLLLSSIQVLNIPCILQVGTWLLLALILGVILCVIVAWSDSTSVVVTTIAISTSTAAVLCGLSFQWAAATSLILAVDERNTRDWILIAVLVLVPSFN